MTACERSDMLFDALLKAAVSEAYEKEINTLMGEADQSGDLPSPALDKRIEGRIKTNYRKIKTKRFIKGLSKAAACLCVLLAVSSVILMSVQATRNAIFNAVLTWREQYTEIEYGEAEAQTGILRPTYLPEGYSEQECRPGGIMTMIVYENESGDQIIFMQEEAGHGKTAVDNEHTDYFKVQISGNEGHLFQAQDEGNASMLIWEEHGIVFNLIAVLDSEELIRIGESIK